MSVNDLCAECLADPCYCEMAEAMAELHDRLDHPGLPWREQVEILAQFDTEWQTYRERANFQVLRLRNVEIIRDERFC